MISKKLGKNRDKKYILTTSNRKDWKTTIGITPLVLALATKLDFSFLQCNSLWPSEAIWQNRSGSTLDQVMACCLMAPSHYLNQCSLPISESNFTASVQDTILYNEFENHTVIHFGKKSNTDLRYTLKDIQNTFFCLTKSTCLSMKSGLVCSGSFTSDVLIQINFLAFQVINTSFLWKPMQ